uniref:TRMT1-like protein isoform X1 n=2 Tax=Myxine glutinosa TaxID=7769 RepID=UPI00358FA3D0
MAERKELGALGRDDEPMCLDVRERENPEPRSSSTVHRERHFSIQKTQEDLESLLPDDTGVKIPCPLCPEEKFRPNYSHKVRKHMGKLHWGCSLVCDGLTICVCYLSCHKPRKPDGAEVSTKTYSHYHCAVCSATVNRRSDMLAHLQGHQRRGESLNFQPDVPQVLHEGNTQVHVLPNYSTPERSDSFFNPRMKLNRQLVMCTLAALVHERQPLDCLDAFGATGIMGLQWARLLGGAVRVTINDLSEQAADVVEQNVRMNGLAVQRWRTSWDGHSGEEEGKGDIERDGEADFVLGEKEGIDASGTSQIGIKHHRGSTCRLAVVERHTGVNTMEMDKEEENNTSDGNKILVTQLDANVLMHLRAYDFIHLDPFGPAVCYLDAAFRNVRTCGIVSITSTDLSALYCTCANIATRHYACSLVRTEYYRELATRVVIAAAARAAARCHKGVEVLLAVALEHFVLVVLRVLRGPAQADQSVRRIRRLLHCQWCEERLFLRDTNMLEEEPYRQLPCDCHRSMPGRSALLLGPAWAGSLYNAGFLRQMLVEAERSTLPDVQPLLKTLCSEVECNQSRRNQSNVTGNVSTSPGQESENSSSVTFNVLTETTGKRKQEASVTLQSKKPRGEPSDHPAFYYSLPRHSEKNGNLPRMNKFLSTLVAEGFRASRTHFEPLAIRTDCPLSRFQTILQAHSQPQNCKGLEEGKLTQGKGKVVGCQSIKAKPVEVRSGTASTELP